MENDLADDKGEYNSRYTINAGSYDKMYASFPFTESEDNFISSSRSDFNGRYRAVSMADLFPDGFRRLLANNLTGDDFIKGPRLDALDGRPATGADGFPTRPIGWVSWWERAPRLFPESWHHSVLVCGR